MNAKQKHDLSLTMLSGHPCAICGKELTYHEKFLNRYYCPHCLRACSDLIYECPAGYFVSRVKYLQLNDIFMLSNRPRKVVSFGNKCIYYKNFKAGELQGDYKPLGTQSEWLVFIKNRYQ